MGISPVIHLSPSRSHLHPRLQRAGTGALMQSHHVREMETFHIVNPQVVRETLMRKKASKEHPELLGEGDSQDSKRQEPCLTLYWLPFFTALLHPWEAGSSPRALLEVKAFNSWFEGFGHFKPPRDESILESLIFEFDFLSKQKGSWA